MSDAAPVPPELSPEGAVAASPLGAWAVGVSGGADSVALIRLLHAQAVARRDVALHVVHLDHQTRGQASTDDGAFVGDLASRLGLPCTLATRAEVEGRLEADDPLPTNPSARYRALRHALFQEVTAKHDLDGVLLAHHADDQAETVLHRLLRGSGYAGLVGMEPRTRIGPWRAFPSTGAPLDSARSRRCAAAAKPDAGTGGLNGGLTLVRPLLGIRREALREYLRLLGQPWREDASNASDDYARNRLRRVLRDRPAMTADLLALADACRNVRDWARGHAGLLEDAFAARALADAPTLLARESARQWLVAHGVPPDPLPPATLDRLIAMAADAATPAGQHFPGRVLVRRRGGRIFVG